MEDDMVGWHLWPNGRLSKFQEMVKDREDWRATVHGFAELDTTERLNNKGLS